ncbi:hypothetical protein [Helicobacter canis]|uniref:hypothetical protein n=1 Tax=Helicobacter canis TaxID=29419 RepID=UPI0015F1020D|nr:hypothetical protein [Helicobacter canis]
MGRFARIHFFKSLFYFSTILRIAVGAVVALRLMVKVSELGVRAFAISRNTAALLTQD